MADELTRLTYIMEEVESIDLDAALKQIEDMYHEMNEQLGYYPASTVRSSCKVAIEHFKQLKQAVAYYREEYNKQLEICDALDIA